MSTILSFLLVALSMGPASSSSGERAAAQVPSQESRDSSAAASERIELRKDGGPGHGVDQPYLIREQGAQDLERFVGGKQVVFVAPYDVFVLVLIVVLIVVLIIVL